MKLDSNLFEILAVNISEGVILFDPEGDIKFSNPAAQLIFEPNADLTLKNLADYISAEPYQEFLTHIECLDVGEYQSWDFEIRASFGAKQNINLVTSLFYFKDNPIKHFLGIVYLQSSSQILNGDEQTSELQYRSIVEEETDLIFRFRPNGTISYANEAYCQYWDKERSELIGTNMMAVIPKEDRPRIRSQFISLTAGCPAVTFEARVIMPDGATRWLQRTDRAVFDEHDQPVEFISVSHDITERIQVENALKHQLALEDIVMNISARFIDVAPAEIDREIHRALRLLGEFMVVDRCYLHILKPGQGHIQKSYEWTGTQIRSSLFQPDRPDQFRWAMSKLARFETIRISNLENLPEEAAVEKKYWAENGIHSLLSLPLVHGNNLIGFFGFATVSNEIEWTEDEVGLLKVIGEIFVSVWMRKLSIEALQETQIQLNQRIKELENRAREINLLTEMSNMLQIASEFEETYLIVADYASRLLPGMNGSLWMMNPASSTLTLKSQWGQIMAEAEPLLVEDCWALRRGRLYQSAGDNPALYCKHIRQPLPAASFCVPIIVQGKTVGLLHLQTGNNQSVTDGASQQMAAVTAEQVGLALANLQLRQDLHDQALRDPLTGLYNRYYMEISLERELNRAARGLNPVSVIMLDIDHFHKINEEFSRSGGDRLLSELGKIMRRLVRADDIASRTGGEEFILILPDTSLETALVRVEQLKEEIQKLSIWFEGHRISTITLSVGLSCWPQNALNVYDLIRSVEAALRKAKSAGPNQVVIAD